VILRSWLFWTPATTHPGSPTSWRTCRARSWADSARTA
jgi:hypothetical protein